MGGFVSVGARSSDASLSLEARAFAPAPSQIEAQTAFDVSLVSAAVLPCTHPSMFYACAEIEIGRMQVRSRLEPDSKGYLRVAAGARAGVELPLVEDVSLRGHADVLFPVAAAKITVSGRTAFEPSPLTALLGADVLWSF